MKGYKSVTLEATIENVLDTTPIEDLRDEMQDWADNLSGTALENTGKYEEIEEAISQLDGVDKIDFDEIWGAVPEGFEPTVEEMKAICIKTSQRLPYGKRHPSRACRLDNAVTSIRDGLEELRMVLDGKNEAHNILEAIDEIDDKIQELDSVDFPGMFG